MSGRHALWPQPPAPVAKQRPVPEPARGGLRDDAARIVRGQTGGLAVLTRRMTLASRPGQ